MNNSPPPYVVCHLDCKTFWAGVGVGVVTNHADALRYDWDSAVAIQSWLNKQPKSATRWTVRVVPHE